MKPTQDRPFVCSGCGATYLVVTVAADGEVSGDEIGCVICSEGFAAARDGNVFKYFLVGRGSSETHRDPALCA